MRFAWSKKVLPMMGLLLVAGVMAACGGGGGGAADGGAAKATVEGLVTFPNMNSMIAKRVSSLVVAPVDDATVEVYGLDGKKAIPDIVYKDVAASFSYKIPLPTGSDYIVKVKRGQQVLKKLVARKDVVTKADLKIDAGTTATVVIASQKLSGNGVTVVLGEPVAGTVDAARVTSLSESIKAMNPEMIDFYISTTVTNQRAALTPETVNYANVYNLVVAAVSNLGSIEALTGDVTVADVKTFAASVDGAVTLTTSAISATSADTLVSDASTNYVPPTGDAATFVAKANSYLSQQDIVNAYKNFELALAADSNNVEANIGGAITSGMMLLEDEQVKAILLKWEVVLPTVNQIVKGTLPFDNLFGSVTSKVAVPTLAKTVANVPVASVQDNKILAAFDVLKAKMPQQKAGFKSLAKELGMVPTTAPSVSEMQAVIDNVIIPRLDQILARLAKVEAVTDNSYTITKAMQGNPLYGEDVVLSNGEYFALDAALNVFQTLFKIATAYNLDVPTGYTYDTISQDPLAMINVNTSFLNLRTGGADKMKSALTNVKAAVAKIESAYAAISIRLGTDSLNTLSWTEDDKTKFLAAIDLAKAALIAPTLIPDEEKIITVDLSKFFNNPLTRANLPAFGYDVPRDAALSLKYKKPVAAEQSVINYYGPSTQVVYCSIQPKGDLPDYTLNGILPGNTSINNFAGFNGIMPMISGAVLSGEPDLVGDEYTSDGDSIYYLTYRYTGYALKKINTTTGLVSLVATGNASVSRLFWYNNQLYSMKVASNAVSLSPITTDGGVYTVGNPVSISAPVGSGPYSYITAATSNDNDIYYAVRIFDWTTMTSIGQIRKLSNLETDTHLFSIDESVDSIGIRGSYIYVNGDKRSLATPDVVESSYPNIESAIMSGGYFYDIDDGKIVKYAGTPSGDGIAKAILGF